jgi:ribonuclease BN (tRNA processing enzyme)
VEEVVEMAYTGDTVLEAVLGEELVLTAKTLIIECTYLEGDVTWAHK